MKSRLSSRYLNEDKVDPRAIAIVGMSCRLPGAEDLAAFWKQLQAGVDAVSEIPANRTGLQGYTSTVPATPGRSISQQGGFLKEIDAFDPWFFGISRREAISMDPQQRILLELAWTALEDAGIPATALRGSRTGVYVGVCYNDFNDIQIQSPATFDVYRMIGGTRSMLCGRISHALGLAGPSLTVDSACASSLVAVHLALQSLRSGESSLALVAAVNLLLHPMVSVGFSQARMLAPDSRCKAFSDAADGFVRSEGAGLVVLKPLAAALRDGDRVYAVLHGSAVNNDGAGESPLMTPSVIGQEAVLRAAYADAGIDPSWVGYIEAHGTGTAVGDPIETKALGAVLSPGRQSSCRLGSVKTNIGHTEAAAGLASLIKAALCLHHRTLVPSLHCQTPNPAIPWAAHQLEVQRTTEAWSADARPRIAGVSSFGLNGTNAHIVLGEAPARRQLPSQDATPPQPPAQLLVISAHSPQALKTLADAYHLQLATGPGPVTAAEFADYCAAAALRRTPLAHRLALVARTPDEAVESLTAFLNGGAAPQLAKGTGARPPLVYLYSGQGSQWTGMGRALHAVSATFRESLARCDVEIARHTGRSIAELVLRAPLTELPGIDLIQPLLFAMQVSVTAVFLELGLVPDLVIGHSMGEVAAAHVAGALDLEAACRIICQRSRLLRSKSGLGAMAVVELPLHATEDLLRVTGVSAQVSVAVSSSATSTVISGEPGAVRSVVSELVRHDIFARLIQVDVASHSPQMDELREPLLAALAGLAPSRLTIPMTSTVTAQPLSGLELGAAYWVDNLRQPVLLSPVLDALLRSGECSFVEMSPHPVLLNAVQQCQEARGRRLAPLPAMRKPEDDWAVLLSTVGALFTRGHAVALPRLYAQGTVAVALPAYPFQREICLDEQTPSALLTNERESRLAIDDCLGTRLELATGPASQIWRLDSRHPLLRSFAEHCVFGEPVVPGAATVCWALTTAQRAGLNDQAVEDVRLTQVLFLPPGREVKIQLVVTEERGVGSRLQVYAATEGSVLEGFSVHAQAQLRPARLSSAPQYMNLSTLRRQSRTRLDKDTLYHGFAKLGLGYGAGYQSLLYADVGPFEALGTLSSEGCTSCWAHGLSPAMFDGCLQLLVVAAGGIELGRSAAGSGYLPVSIEAVRVRGELARGRVLYAKARPPTPEQVARGESGRLSGDIWLLAADGEVLLEIVGVAAQALRAPTQPIPEWHVAWRPHEPYVVTDKTSRSPSSSPGHFLVLGSPSGPAAALVSRLRMEGRRCLWVSAGSAYAKLGDDRFEVATSSAADWLLLQRELLAASSGPCLGAVYLLGLEAGDSAEPRAADFPRALDCGCLAFTAWLQAYLQLASDTTHFREAGLLVVTREARAISAGAATRPLQAMLWGFAGVVRSEHPELRVRRVDLDLVDHEAAAALLQRELGAGPTEDTVAWRSGRRYGARLVAGLPDGPQQVPGTAVRGDATYLVTGGLSGLGLRTAEWLVEQGAKRLLLLGRSAPSLSSAQVIDRLRQRGVEVSVARADVCDLEQLKTALARTESPSHPLRGVFHSAAVLEDGVLVGLRPEELARVIAPKVLGALHLHMLTAALELDYFVVYSSVAAVLGNPGQSSYCAANAFLDALAESRVAHDQAALSIAWGPWAEIGLAARAELGERLSARGLPSLSPQAGMAALARLLLIGSTSCCPIVSRFEVESWLQGKAGAGPALFREARPSVRPSTRPLARPNRRSNVPAAVRPPPPPSRPASAAPPLREVLLTLPAGDRTQFLADALRELVGQILRATASQRSQLAVELPLTRLGLDSLMAVELRNRIDAELGVRVPLSLVMQNGTIASIAAQILQDLPVSEPPKPATAVWDEGEL